MKKCDFLHVDTDSWKLKLVEKYWGGHGQKRVWPLWSKGTKIGCISRRNEWNKLIFGVFI